MGVDVYYEKRMSDLRIIRARRFGTAIEHTIERQQPGVSVAIDAPEAVSNERDVAEAGGLHFTIEGTTWDGVTTTRDHILDGLERMGLDWERHEALEHRGTDDTAETSRMALVTEALTKSHLARSPWQPTTPRAAPVIYADRGGIQSSVSRDDPTTFPLQSMTDDQRAAFREFLRVRMEDWFNILEPIWLALLLTCDRPGANLSTIRVAPDREDVSMTIDDVLDAFDLTYRYWSVTNLDVARTSWRLDLLPTERPTSSEGFHRRLGCFYGYPEADIDFFLEKTDKLTFNHEYVEAGRFDADEIAYTTFVPWGHDDSAAACERAIERGKSHRATIAEAAEKWDLPGLEAYADWVYREAVAECLIHTTKENTKPP